MQMRQEWFFAGRALYYWAKFHRQQMQEGDFYQTLRPTISIWIVNEVVVEQVQDWHLMFRLWDPAHQVGLTDDLAIHVIQLPQFTKGLDELETALDRWCWLLRHAASMDADRIPSPLKVPAIRRAVEVLKMLKQSDVERERYEARLKAERDRGSSLLAAEQRGEKRGKKLGEKLGEKRGKERARHEELIERIQLFESLLNRPPKSDESLNALSIAELTILSNQLVVEMRGK